MNPYTYSFKIEKIENHKNSSRDSPDDLNKSIKFKIMKNKKV